MEFDFSGYATRADTKCSDGRTIKPNAFKSDNGRQVPLCWQHGHSDVNNVLGHATLENRVDGVYAYCKFNETVNGQNARALVKHGDVKSLSIYANNLVERGKDVIHGTIREVSLVLAGANPGALIDNIILAHDGMEDILDDEAVIYSGEDLEIRHASLAVDDIADVDSDESSETDEVQHSETETEDRTFADIYTDMDEEQKAFVRYLMSQLPDEPAEHGDNDGEVLGASDPNNTNNADEATEGFTMSHNIFESGAETRKSQITLSHSDIKGIVEDARKMGSLKDAVEKYALQHGIENLDLMFPDAQAVTNTPDFVKRQTEWVNEVMSNTRHTPFSRIKSLTADLTVEEARAKGYIKGNMKQEEFFSLAKRVTTPQTVYKKQKLDRDDIVDITDFDVVNWLKAEMRLMLNEELARAILIGDGRSNADDDKIKEDNIRPIATDAELYVTKVYAKMTDTDASDVVDSVVRFRRHYKGSGNPMFFTSEDVLATLLLSKDTIGRRLYPTVNDLQAALRVSKVVAVEVFDTQTDLLGIMVNLNDYVIGSDKGGAVSLFDDFDIDYNQFKYLIETRLSGALVRPKSAVVIMKAEDTDILAEPIKPAYNVQTGVITIPTVAGVIYESPRGTAVSGTLTVSAGETVVVYATPDATHYFATDAEDEWGYARKA